ncbi:MAG: hypothetical protein NTX64_14345 [Elusimicrobia bacterium]|nr:hypothetical protein [Elusimicrobiota bacterium]
MRACRIRIALVALCAAGCSAELVEMRKPRPGPVASVVLDAGGGHVQYSLRGPGFVVSARRKDALEKMAEACGGEGRFRIVDEVARQEAQASFLGGDVDEEGEVSKASRHYDFVTTQHVYFECEK